MQGPSAGPGPAGVTLLELLVVIVVLGTLTALSFSGLRELRESARLHAATRSVWSQLALARTVALGRRESIRVREGPSGDLSLFDAQDRRLTSAPVGPGSELAVDSIRLRPAVLRFNSRGQAAPGSVYLYHGSRVARVVSNFLGRLRVEVSRAR